MNQESRRGFTLIEVMLTMSLLGILAVLSSPFYGRFIFSQEVPVARDELQGSFSKAQLYSIEGKGAAAWGVAIDSDQIILFQGDSFSGRDPSFDETFSIHPKITISGLETEVVFARTTGRPDRQPTISVSGNGATQTLSMNAEGVLQEE